MTKLAVLPAEPAIEWVTGVKQTKCEADRSPLFIAKVNEWNYISPPSIRLHGIIRNKFMFTSKMEEVAKLL
jgi:hypothetical protein